MLRPSRRARLPHGAPSTSTRPARPAAPARHLVLVAVEDVDQRLVDLCMHAVAHPGAAVEAVCLADDVAACRDAVTRWQRLRALEVPVDVVDAEHRTVAEAIRARVTTSLAGGWDHVTVLVPHLVFSWPWSMLHNHTSNAVTRTLRGMPHVDVVRVPVTPGRA